MQVGSWQVALGRQHGRTRRKGRGEAHSCKGEGHPGRGSGRCQGPEVHLCLHGTQSWHGSPQTAHCAPPSVEAHPGHHCILGLFQHLTPGQKLSQCQQDPQGGMWRLCQKACAEGDRGHPLPTQLPPSTHSSSLLRAPHRHPGVSAPPWSHLHERQRVLGPIHRAWCDPLGGTDDLGVPSGLMSISRAGGQDHIFRVLPVAVTWHLTLPQPAQEPPPSPG